MEIMPYLRKHGHEFVGVFQDKKSGLELFIAIHDTTLGPALGGCRMWDYEKEESPGEAALSDVLRLSKGMTYKASAAGLNLGGGKAVILANSKKLTKKKRVEIFKKFGEIVNSLEGKYITAEDVGTNVEDMKEIFKKTRYVTGIPEEMGGSGDPSPLTAFGVYKGMTACVEEALKTSNMNGLRVAVEGLGHVGYLLAKMLHENGAKLIVSDIKEELTKKAAEEFNAKIVSPEDIRFEECEVYAPCALGGVINDHSLAHFNCKIIAGAANNQLATQNHGDQLHQKGILYAPDYVLNAGGLLNVSCEESISGESYNRDKSLELVAKVYDRIKEVIRLSKENTISTCRAADVMAEQRIEEARKKNKK
ncbi:Glu/Leu/Phe/Val dehydrogenase [Candidatus Woesearchaeota archaeon]|nr:Glu/Leu/Phe/Val dehydrogenase [Candidatus Woesearchaeota archaeon]